MKSPTINNYLETVAHPAGRFKSLSGIEIMREENGEFCYAVRSKTLDIAIKHQGRNKILCCPLHPEDVFDLQAYVANRYGKVYPGGKAELLLREMLVFNDRGESGWHDLLLVQASWDTLRAKTSGPEEKSGGMETGPVFYEGLAAVQKEGKYGYTDRSGKEIIPLQYDWADAFDEGLALVKKGNLFGLVDKQGYEVLEPVYEDIRWHSGNGVVLACSEGIWTVRNRRGMQVSPNTFDFIFDFSEGLASVCREGKYGFIDRAGEIKIPLVYDEAYSFSKEGLATVVKNGITFCIDTEGMVFD